MCGIAGWLSFEEDVREKRDAQNPEDLLVPSEQNYLPLLERWDGIRMMGAAPEIPGALELGRELTRRGIVASVAHSDATYDQVLEAIEHGYRWKRGPHICRQMACRRSMKTV